MNKAAMQTKDTTKAGERTQDEWTASERYNTLLNNGLDWYLVDYEDGATELKHATQLSSVLQAGESPEDHGIARMQQCWNGEACGAEGEV